MKKIEIVPLMELPPDDQRDWQVPKYNILRWAGKSAKFCVVIPVINEGERIRDLLSAMHALEIHLIADIIVVDGGSTDGSLESEILDRYSVRALLRKTGNGRLSAQLRCAYAFALEKGYNGVITIDGNNKDDPAPIPAFVELLNTGTDFVQASRFLSGGIAENTPLVRDLAIRYIHAPLLSLSSGFRWTDTTQGFRGYSARLLMSNELAIFRDVFSSYELLAYLSYRAPLLGFSCTELATKRSYPVGEVPTKISAIRGNWAVFKTLLVACSGGYNPPKRG